MYKLAILIPTLVLFGAGSALAFDAAQGFGPSDSNDQPVPRYQTAAPIDHLAVTSSIDRVTTSSLGSPLGTGSSVGFSAAQGFGPSDSNDQPVPRYQTVR